MARWKLTEPHYLTVPGTKWEYTENDRTTNRPKRTQFDVPLFLDPRDYQDWNYNLGPMEGEIIVCYKDKGLAKDIVFIGNPTPGMLPLDDEAKEISAKFTWTPTKGLTDQEQLDSFSGRLSDMLVQELAKAQAHAQQAPVAPGMDKFMEMMAAMMQQQTMILAQLAGKSAQSELAKQAEALGEKPIVDDAEPLEEVEPTEEELIELAKVAAERDKASVAKATTHASMRRI